MTLTEKELESVKNEMLRKNASMEDDIKSLLRSVKSFNTYMFNNDNHMKQVRSDIVGLHKDISALSDKITKLQKDFELDKNALQALQDSNKKEHSDFVDKNKKQDNYIMEINSELKIIKPKLDEVYKKITEGHME